MTAPAEHDTTETAETAETLETLEALDAAPVRRFFRLRAPDPTAGSVAVTVRVTEGEDLYLAVGPGRRRMYLTPNEAWALWRCLSEAAASTGAPPDWIRVPITPRTR